MTKPRKHTILVAFLLLSLLAPLKNIATNYDRNEEPIYIITDSNKNITDINRRFAERYHIVLETNPDTLRTIDLMLYVHNDLGILRNIYRLLFITGSIYISLYNYLTEHNKRKQGWYHSKFLVYFGIKKNITKNFHLDLYFSLLNFCANLVEYLFLTEDLLFLIFKIISPNINIRIYKNFYFCLNPMSFILIGLLHIKSSLIHSKKKRTLLHLFQTNQINPPQNFNLSNIRCFNTGHQEHACLFYFNTNNII